jgi:hypothetical protein
MKLSLNDHIGNPVNLHYRLMVTKVLSPDRIIHSWGPVRDVCNQAHLVIRSQQRWPI